MVYWDIRFVLKYPIVVAGIIIRQQNHCGPCLGYLLSTKAAGQGRHSIVVKGAAVHAHTIYSTIITICFKMIPGTYSLSSIDFQNCPRRYMTYTEFVHNQAPECDWQEGQNRNGYIYSKTNFPLPDIDMLKCYSKKYDKHVKR